MSQQPAATVTKPPAAVRWHAVDISPYLGAGETVTEFAVTASDPALVIATVTLLPGKVRWKVSGGLDGRDYLVTVTVATNLERKEPVFIKYRIRQPKGAPE